MTAGIIASPTNYSEADRDRIELCLARLRQLEQEYRDAARPIMETLAHIEASYAHQYVMAPSAETGE